MDVLRELLGSFASGLWAPFPGVWRSRRHWFRVWPQVLQLCLHNGVLFLGSVLMYRGFIIPWAVAEAPDWSDSWWEGILSVVWLVPLWMYSVFSNAFLHQSIATALLISPSASSRLAQEGSSDVAGIIYRSAVFSAFQVVANASFFSSSSAHPPPPKGICFLSGFAPFVGLWLQFALYSWMFSAFCFEYKWRASYRMSVFKCMEYFESRWLYLVGFGVHLTLVYYVTSSFWIAYPIVQLLIPIFCAAAIYSPDPPEQRYIPRLYIRAFTDTTMLKPLVGFLRSRVAQRRGAKTNE